MSSQNFSAARQPLKADGDSEIDDGKLVLLGTRQEAIRTIKLLHPVYWSWQERELTIEFEIPPVCQPFSAPERRGQKLFRWVNNIVAGAHFWTIVDVKEAWSSRGMLMVVFEVCEWPEHFTEEYYRSARRDTIPPPAPPPEMDAPPATGSPLEYFFKR
ncbi:MAG: hypothetical protein PHD72_01640 [Patescibacteria group bacterium]|nr:hypothetical protein [Patescibacteria group bacterium]